MGARISVFLLMLACVLDASAAWAESNALETQLAAVEKAVTEARQKLGVPGVAVAVVKDDRIIISKGFGLRNIKKELPITADTLFAIGSCTKAFTAMATVMSQDEGKLSLEDSPRKYLPYFKLRDPQADSAVTLRDLLTHRTGLGRFDLAWLTGVLTNKEVIQVAGLAVPTAKLRERFQYQNAMYSAASEVVAAANKSTWEAVIARRFFAPLGMKSSNTAVKATQQAADLASGYSLDEGVASEVPRRESDNIAPAGAINSTVNDMAQWVRLMLGKGVFEGKRLVSEKGFAELLTPQIPTSADSAYGLGWNLHQWHGQRVVSHGGGIDGFNALVGFMPDKQLGFVVLTNVTASPLPQIAQEAIWANLVGEPSELPKAEPPASVPRQRAEDRNPSAPNIDVTVNELMVKMIEAAGGENNLRRHHSSSMRWHLDLENQGLEGRLTVHAQAPNSVSVQTTLLGLGRQIGTTRTYFDGAKGSEESSFAPSRTLDEKQLQDYRIAGDFYELLNWKALYREVKITGTAEVDGEQVYVVVKSPAQVAPLTDYISTRRFLPLRRDRLMSLPKGMGALPVTEVYSDYRTVDGVAVPFKLVTQNPFAGRVTARLEEVRYNVAPPH